MVSLGQDGRGTSRFYRQSAIIEVASGSSSSTTIPNLTFLYHGDTEHLDPAMRVPPLQLRSSLTHSCFVPVVLHCQLSIQPQEALTSGYHGLIVSRRRYGIILWGFSAYINCNRICILQKRALRVVSVLGPQESYFMTVKFPRTLIYYFIIPLFSVSRIANFVLSFTTST